MKTQSYRCHRQTMSTNSLKICKILKKKNLNQPFRRMLLHQTCRRDCSPQKQLIDTNGQPVHKIKYVVQKWMEDKNLIDNLVNSYNCYLAHLRMLQLLQLSFVNLTVEKVSWILILPREKLDCMIAFPQMIILLF